MIEYMVVLLNAVEIIANLTLMLITGEISSSHYKKNASKMNKEKESISHCVCQLTSSILMK